MKMIQPFHRVRIVSLSEHVLFKVIFVLFWNVT